MGPDYDVVIIGGGPAGAATAGYLTRAGLTCIVLEKEQFPRPHVGESFVPATTRVFKDLGFLPKMEEAGFPRKYGAAWTTTTNTRVYDHDWDGMGEDCQVDVRFEERAQEGVDQNYTYHVDRARFDQLLLRHVEEMGATVWEKAAVLKVDFSGEPLVQVTYRRDGEVGTVRARLVVDASGRRTLLGNQLGLKVNDPVFDQYALHTWFEGYDRGATGRADFIYVHFLPISSSWVWQIPITDTITSIGVVTQKRTFAAAKDSHEAFFWHCVESRPEVAERLRQARQLRPLTAEGDYSYAMREICGDRFVLVGDAARFVDPIFSSGVSIALNSARLASRDIIRAAERGVFDKESFHEYQTVLRRGCNNWYKFITLYYRLNVLFTYFLGDPRYRLDVLKLLQGDLYDEDEPAVLTKMRQMVQDVEENENHVWHKLLGSLTSESFKPAF